MTMKEAVSNVVAIAMITLQHQREGKKVTQFAVRMDVERAAHFLGIESAYIEDWAVTQLSKRFNV